MVRRDVKYQGMKRLAVFVTLLSLIGCGHSDSQKASIMILSLSNGTEIHSPSDEQIRRSLSELNFERDGEGFAILGLSKTTYVQVSGDPVIGFDLEYQTGSASNHYRAAREDYSLDEAVAVLVAYRDGEVTWSKVGDFTKIAW